MSKYYGLLWLATALSVGACYVEGEPEAVDPIVPLAPLEAPLSPDPTCPVSVPRLDGEWRTLSYVMPVSPIAAELLHDGRVVFMAGSENDAFNSFQTGSMAYRGAIWDPTVDDQSGISAFNLEYDFFCLGTAQLPDGRALLAGGSRDYSFKGDNRVSIWNPITGTVNEVQSMAQGRWYPTMLTVGDGRVFIWSGINLAGATNANVEFYDLRTAGAAWGTPIAPNNGVPTPPLFPRMHLLSDGRVFYTGQGSGARSATSWFFNPSTNQWSAGAAPIVERDAGASVLLPLYGPNYANKVIIFGGSGRNTSELIDLSAPTPVWAAGPTMSAYRIHGSATLLPNGQVVVHGGSAVSEVPDLPGKEANLYHPATNTLSSAGTASYSRLYHSVSLLLADATVAVLGSNPASRGQYEPAIEIYRPAYLFDANDQLITTGRPSISSVSATKAGYGATLTVSYSASAPIATAVLVRPGAATHALDPEQRVVELCGTHAGQTACAGNGSAITLTTPPNGNVAPPGWYMLFLLDSNGVPSHATWIQLSPYATTPPTGAITVPANNTTVTAGGAMSFGTSTVAAKYSWSFPGGTPAYSSAQNPGSVTFNTPGTYVATLTAIDAAGNSDPNPPTRTITVLPSTPDFRVSVGPTSRRILPGQSTTFAVDVSALAGFAGTVILTVGSEGGFPSGVTSGGFSPATVVGSGSTTLTLNAAASAQPYALQLTITGTSGSTSRKASTTLIVGMNPPTTVSATPGPGQITLTWTAAASVSRYIIKRSLTAGGPYTAIGCATGGTTTFTDASVVAGTTYYYTVASQLTTGANGGGQSVLSAEVSAIPLTGSPSAPTGLTATAGPARVDLTWTGSAGATSYNVKRSTSAAGPFATVGATASAAYTDATATNGTTYWYVVSAVNALGESGNSASASATPQGPPAAPTNLVAIGGTVSVALTWTASANAASYRVGRATLSGGPYTLVASPTTASYTDTGATSNTVTYYYVVTAVGVGGESAASAEASTPLKPKTPTGLTRSLGNTVTELRWSAAPGATSYRIQRATATGGPYTTVGTATTPFFAGTGLTNGSTYYWTVQSVNVAGTSASSTKVSGKPAATTLSFNTPKSGTTVSGTAVSVKVTATYALGTSTWTLKRDGVVVQTLTSTGSSVTFTWNTTTTTNGSHALTATITDAYGKTASAGPRNVSVSN